jgi:hypothetical protein
MAGVFTPSMPIKDKLVHLLMRFINFHTTSLRITERYTTKVMFPYITYHHSTVFQTVALNNAVDAVMTVFPDSITVFVLYPLAAIGVGLPQLVFNAAGVVSVSLYWCFHDFDAYLARCNFKQEP